MAEAHRIPKETSGESGGVGVFVKCIAQGTHRCDESLCWVAEAQSEPEGESCGDTDVRSVYVVGVAWVWRGRLAFENGDGERPCQTGQAMER